ncbi:chorismate mutase [Candidatus Saccharibacteria bacterium]|nr:chorismate mutase [Candidatus Saccharibacteria bacterium]
MRSLDQIRADIDVVDKALINDLKRRFELTHETGVYKKTHNLPSLDNTRYQKC